MGGHSEIPEVPDYKIYKIENYPELQKLQDRLAKHGLKDPWIRNEAWRFDPRFGTPWGRLFSVLFRGFLKVGLPAFLLTIGYEHTFGTKDHHGEHHDEHHDEHH